MRGKCPSIKGQMPFDKGANWGKLGQIKSENAPQKTLKFQTKLTKRGKRAKKVPIEQMTLYLVKMYFKTYL